jgi:hypothetical protein
MEMAEDVWIQQNKLQTLEVARQRRCNLFGRQRRSFLQLKKKQQFYDLPDSLARRMVNGI